MTQPRVFTIKKWVSSSDSYSGLVQVGSALIIFPILMDYSLLWLDQSNNLCMIRSLTPNEPILRVNPEGAIDMPLLSAELKYPSKDTVAVSLTWAEVQGGPTGTITAEANPPIQDDLPKGFWRWLRPLFRWFRSLFR